MHYADIVIRDVHFVYPQNARKELMHALSIHVRNWFVHWAMWACTSGTYVCVSIWIRNWCVHWAYASGTNACTEHSPFKICRAYASGTDTYPVHTGQELMRTLSTRVKNWCVPWAYASVSFAYAQHKRKNSKFEKVPSKHAEHACNVRNWCARSACPS